MGKSKSNRHNLTQERVELIDDHPELARLQSKLSRALDSGGLVRSARVANVVKVLESQASQFDVETENLAHLVKLLRGVK